MRGDPIKYEVDKETGAVFVDRFMSTAMHYPCNYGYIPQTLSDDGDPCDVLVLSPVPLITGVVVRCRPIGMLKMDDEAGGDAKILAVPIDKLSSLYRNDRVAARPARDQTRRSRISSSTTRTSSRASGCASAAGSGPRMREARDPRSRSSAKRAKRAARPANFRRRRRRGSRARGAVWLPRCSSCCGAPASSPPSSACRTRRRSRSCCRFALVAALMSVVRWRPCAAGRAQRATTSTSRSSHGSSTACISAACSSRCRAACPRGRRRCWSDCSRSLPCSSPASGWASASCRASGWASRSGSSACRSSFGRKSGLDGDVAARAGDRRASRASASARCGRSATLACRPAHRRRDPVRRLLAALPAARALAFESAPIALDWRRSVRARLVGAGALGRRDQPACTGCCATARPNVAGCSIWYRRSRR